MTLQQCMWCQGMFPVSEGATHEYMESTPGCWASFGRVLAREYSNPDLMPVHRLSVDSYSVQHPGRSSRQSIQSVGVHLVRLCLFLEHDLSPQRANDAMLAAAKHKSEYTWLQPPESLGPLTVANIEAAQDAAEHKTLVRQWAQQMWSVWSTHHKTVRRWALAD